jgi:hypothetical protein
MSAISSRSQLQPADAPSEFGWHGHHQFHLQVHSESTHAEAVMACRTEDNAPQNNNALC